MKKVFGAIAGLVFGLFGLGIIALVMSLTYSGLQRIFPDNPANQMWGLVIFDIAVIAWALAFAFKSNSLGQYGAAGAGFLVGFAGTGLMVYAEVTLSGQQLTGGAANTAEIGQWMIWAFVFGSLIHVALIWMHHATDPDLATQISTGVAQGLIRDKARAAAEHQLEVEAEYLARAITAEAVAKARRDLHVPGGQIIDLPALPVDNSLYVPANGYPTPAQKKAPGIFSKQYWKERFGNRDQDPRQYEQTASQVEEQPGAPDNYGPLWNSSTNISPTLDAYNWSCLHCDGSNPAFTRTCSWCGQARTNGSPVTAFADLPSSASRPSHPEAEFQVQVSANDRQGWVETNIGTRTRMWCLECRDQGDIRGFTSPVPCKHVVSAQPVRSVGWDEHVALLHQFNTEANSPAFVTKPVPASSEADLTAEAHALGMWNPNDPNDSPFWRSRPDVHDALTKRHPGQEDADQPRAPFQSE